MYSFHRTHACIELNQTLIHKACQERPRQKNEGKNRDLEAS